MKKIFERIDSLLKREKGVIKKEHGGRIKICLIYPNKYQVGISNLGFQSVYRLFNERKDVVCERSFLPAKEEYSEYEKGLTIFSFESKTPLNEFDILAFSLCFENDYPEVIKIIKLAKLPLLSKERTNQHPLLIAGGVMCFSNPEPLSDVFDIIFIGEAEEMINNFIDIYKAVRDNSYEDDFKDSFKKELLKLEGFYVPELYSEVYDEKGKLQGRKKLLHDAPEKIKKVFCKDLLTKFSYSQIVTPEAVFQDMFLIETMRGCPFSCRFCMVGGIYNPPRKVSIEELKFKIKNVVNSDLSIGLIAPSITAYKELDELLKIPKIEISFTSLRSDSFTLNALDYLSKRKTLTLAPEAGSERLRKVIKKGITEEDILVIARKLSKTELEVLKLYFMIGLPFENDKDIEDIVRLLKELRNIFHRKINVSISIFVPKPFTPFQWHRMEQYETVKEKLKKLKKDTIKIKGFKLVHEVPKYSYLQGYLAQADRRALSRIKRLAEGESVGKIIEEVKESLYAIKSFSDFLPWEFILHEGISKEFLWKDYEKAKIEACQIDNI